MATNYQVDIFGTDIEANPIQKWIMEDIGMWASYVFRIICPTIAITFLLLIKKNEPKWTFIVNFCLWATFLVSLGVMVWHVHVTNFFTLHLNRG